MKVAVIPALDEEDTIGSVVLRTKRHVDKVIVIDDGSRDKTAAVAKMAGADVVKHIKNGGKGSALKTGFKAAMIHNPDVVVCLDGDAQHNPDDIPKVIAPILSGEAEMVIASRYMKKGSLKSIPRYRRVGLWVLNKATNIGNKCKVTDSQCGFRAFSGDVISKFKFLQNGLSVESEMLKDAIENNIKIKEVSISAKYDGLETSTEKPGKHGFGVLGFIINTVKDRRPLFFFGVSGAILLLIGLILGVYCLDYYFTSGSLPFGPSLATSVLVLLGTLSIFTGLILNSISWMVNGMKILDHHHAESYENDIRRQSTLNHYPQELMLANITGQNGHGVSILSNYPNGMSFQDYNEQKIQGVTMLNNHLVAMPLEYFNGQKVQGAIILNNHRQEIPLDNFDEDNALKQILANNHRKKTSPEGTD